MVSINLIKIKHYNLFCRGDEFRTAFAHLGEMRSIIPSDVNVLALTATASKATLAAVTKRLSLSDLIIVAPPYRDNIKLYVKPLPDVKSFCDLITSDIISL